MVKQDAERKRFFALCSARARFIVHCALRAGCRRFQILARLHFLRVSVRKRFAVSKRFFAFRSAYAGLIIRSRRRTSCGAVEIKFRRYFFRVGMYADHTVVRNRLFFTTAVSTRTRFRASRQTVAVAVGNVFTEVVSRCRCNSRFRFATPLAHASFFAVRKTGCRRSRRPFSPNMFVITECVPTRAETERAEQHRRHGQNPDKKFLFVSHNKFSFPMKNPCIFLSKNNYINIIINRYANYIVRLYFLFVN